VKIELPALRQRLEDIPVLVRRMLKDLGDESRTSASPTSRWSASCATTGRATCASCATPWPWPSRSPTEGEELDIAAHLGALTETPIGGGFGGGGGGGAGVSPA
jgi:hypothetical protein